MTLITNTYPSLPVARTSNQPFECVSAASKEIGYRFMPVIHFLGRCKNSVFASAGVDLAKHNPFMSKGDMGHLP